MENLQRIVPPLPGFLEALREEYTKVSILLICDEIVTGFRPAYGGAQEFYGVVPDICTLGKIIGGGFPLAAIGASKDIMKLFDRSHANETGWLMQFGTLPGNPVAASAGLKTLEILRRNGQYERLRQISAAVHDRIAARLGAAGVPHQIAGDATLFDVVFVDRPPRNYRDVLKADVNRTSAFNAALRKNGVLRPPGKFYPSLSLTESDLQLTEDGLAAAVEAIA